MIITSLPPVYISDYFTNLYSIYTQLYIMALKLVRNLLPCMTPMKQRHHITTFRQTEPVKLTNKLYGPCNELRKVLNSVNLVLAQIQLPKFCPVRVKPSHIWLSLFY